MEYVYIVRAQNDVDPWILGVYSNKFSAEDAIITYNSNSQDFSEKFVILEYEIDEE